MGRKITEGLWLVDCRTLSRPNVFIIDDGQCTLVDAGWPGDAQTVLSELNGAGFELEDIDQVLLTHYDADHVGTLSRLTPALDAPIYIHHIEAPYVAGEELPPWTARCGLETVHRLYYLRLTLPDLPIRPIRDGEEIGGFRACHAPGHTPGHTVYFHQELEALLIGDLAYAYGKELRPSGRFFGYDSAKVEESIRALLQRIPPFTYACPGHGPPLRDGYVRLARSVE